MHVYVRNARSRASADKKRHSMIKSMHLSSFFPDLVLLLSYARLMMHRECLSKSTFNLPSFNNISYNYMSINHFQISFSVSIGPPAL